MCNRNIYHLFSAGIFQFENVKTENTVRMPIVLVVKSHVSNNQILVIVVPFTFYFMLTYTAFLVRKSLFLNIHTSKAEIVCVAAHKNHAHFLKQWTSSSSSPLSHSLILYFYSWMNNNARRLLDPTNVLNLYWQHEPESPEPGIIIFEGERKEPIEPGMASSTTTPKSTTSTMMTTTTEISPVVVHEFEVRQNCSAKILMNITFHRVILFVLFFPKSETRMSLTWHDRKELSHSSFNVVFMSFLFSLIFIQSCRIRSCLCWITGWDTQRTESKFQMIFFVIVLMSRWRDVQYFQYFIVIFASSFSVTFATINRKHHQKHHPLERFLLDHQDQTLVIYDLCLYSWISVTTHNLHSNDCFDKKYMYISTKPSIEVSIKNEAKQESFSFRILMFRSFQTHDVCPSTSFRFSINRYTLHWQDSSPGFPETRRDLPLNTFLLK
jgi:hypothetical protein